MKTSKQGTATGLNTEQVYKYITTGINHKDRIKVKYFNPETRKYVTQIFNVSSKIN